MSRFSVHSWQNSFGRITFFISLFAVAALAQNLRFQDVTNSARVSTPNDPNGYGHGVAAGDFNNDGLPDIYVINYTSLNALFLNNGNDTFTETAASANVAYNTTLQDRGVAASDYDDDGDLDLYIASGGYQNNLLFRNNGDGSFSEIANSVGLRNYEMQGESVSWGDYDGDGDLDLFLTSYENPCKLFRQNSDHTFSEVTYASGLGGIAESVQSVFFDLELDGDLDIFISRGQNISNSLLVNRGNGVFVDEAASRNITDPVPHGQGVTVGDYDNDGDLDIYMCDDRGPNRLYRNENGSFNEVAAQAGVDDYSRSLGCLFADFDNDGWLDLYVINFGTNRLYRNHGNGTFEDVTSGSGADNSSRSYGSAVLDYDGDGLLDIYFSNSGQNSNLLRNTTNTSNKWLKLVLRGVSSNRNGIGARVLLTSGGVQQTQQLLAGFAMVSGGSDLTFHFGLGNNSTASRVEVIWPSGERDVLTNVAANQALTIQEGSYGDTPPNDTDPPVISNVASSNMTGSTATITWNTNEAADTQVQYGLTANYGATTPLDAARVLNHSVALSGLAQSTTYHFRALSKDAAGNLASSGDFTFTTPVDSGGGTYTLFADDFTGSTLNTAVWQRGTNSGNQTVVANNALELRSNSSQSGWVVMKQSYAARNTTVTVKVVQPNDDGNLGMSPTYTAGAINGIYNEANWYRFYAYRDTPGNYRLYVLWKKNGAEDGLDVTGNLVITAQSGVYLRLRFDDTHIHFEASLDGVSWNATYSEPFALPGYTLDSNFHYELAASRTPTKGVMIVDDFAITAPGDTQAPLISNVVAAPASGSVTITWNTDEASDSQVEYGTTLSYGSFSPRNSALATAHSVTLSGLSAATTYYYRVRSQDAAGNLALSSGFTFQTASSGGSNITRTILSDAIKGSAKGTRTGGQFAADGGWQVTATGDMLVYDLGAYIENGALEIDIRNFRPAAQNSYNRHHFLSMFRNPWGNHHPAENQETVWDLHAGTNYTPGVKLLSWTYNENEEKNTIKPDDFNQAQTYRVRMVWNGNQLQYFLNGVLQATHTHSSSMQVRYLYVGRDFTVSGDFITNFNNNQYPALVGPIYANLLVTETLATNDTVPPQITSFAASALYANAARLTWTTNEATTCYVEYGPTMSYGQRTSVLGPPEQTHSTALANLNPNQTYHYRIVAQDDAGNTASSGDGTFATVASGVYLFKPIADTFVEQAGLVGKTRDYANFGKMNLALSAGREAYLRFQVSGLTNAVTQTKLRLHGRQTGAPNATVRALTASWNESTVTWLTKPAQFGNTLGTLPNVTAKQWQEVTLAPFVAANGVYDLALLGAGALMASLDARESTNFQPELIVTTLDTIAPTITNVVASNVTSSAATITWNTNEASDSQIEYGLTPSYGNLSALDSNRVSAHTLTLEGLAASTEYHYRVRSRDLAGNLALSNDAVFTTLPIAGLPLISNVTATTITSTTAQITFATDRNAYGSVEFDTSAHAATRIMPLGDSITEGVGSSDEAGYRSGLYAVLTDFGSSFDFVGSLQYGINIPDPDHEGHAGWYANDLLAELQNFLQQSQPQAVFLHIGTNDVSLGDHYGTVVNEITAIVDTILQFNPKTKVYLSTLIPRQDNKQSVTASVNVNLPEVVAERANAGYKIFLVDNSAAFLANPNWATEWMADNVHPNDAGYTVMAQQWQKAFINTEYENALSSNSLATAHSLTLTNLTPGNTYHYRARAKDQAGLESASGDFTFTTPPFTPVTVPLHGIYEITLRAQTSPKNPYVQGPSVAVTFQGASGAALGTTKIVQGFWDGGDTYRVRFAPNKLGDWSWQSSSSDAGLNNQSGMLTCAGALAAPHISARGHVRESKSFPYAFAHEDSTPFFLLGDTQWSFATAAISWPAEFQTYVDARAAQGFNYIHGLIYNVYPVGNEGNEGGPIFHGANVDSLNPGFWQALDQRVAYMNAKGLVVGLMLAWGNGGWQNFSTVTQVDRFVQYTLARYSAYNVFWITAGEYEEAAPPGGHAHVGELIAASDPYVHPITTHTINSSADDFGNAAWHTTIYQQTGSPALITRDRIYNKPVINSEFGYEGDQSAEAVRQDAWQIVMRGGFAVYGDTSTYHYNAKMTSAELNSPGARFMTILKNFWSGNNAPTIAWQRFTRFEVVSGSRFLAGNPGSEYVVYAEGRGTFTVNLSDANLNSPLEGGQGGVMPSNGYRTDLQPQSSFESIRSVHEINNTPLAPLKGGINLASSQSAGATIVNGQWFNTRTGVWGATFSDTASAAFSLTPPDSAHAAYLVVAPPATPPAISQVLASVTSTTTATIAWQTDKPGDSQVEYGLTASYGNVSVLDTTKTLNHEVALAGLAPNTLYHFRARSRAANGALALSGDFTFSTPPNAALLSDNFNTGALDLTKWQRGSNSENQSAVVNNALELRSQSKQSGWVITKQAFVARQTTVTVKVTQPNDDGDLGMSPTYNLTSTSGIYGQENWYRFYVYREATSAYHLYVQWLKAGIAGGLDVTGNLVITAQSGVYLRLRMDDANIHFEASLDGQQWTASYSEVFALPGYTLSDKFYYELAASRTALNGVLRVDDFAIENYTPPSDTLAPVISNVVATNITANAATITWATNEPSDAQVEYGLTSSYGLFSVRDSSRTAAHAITLTNLTSDTTYHFRVRSQDAAGNLALSSDFTFATPAAGTNTPLLSDDFNSGALNASKWQLGANSGNQSAVSNNALQLQSTGSQSGWVMTKQAYAAGNTTVTMKVTQPNNDGALGMSPTFSASSSTGFYNQSNWYRFYVYRDQSSGPYLLYVESKKNGVLAGSEVTGNLAISGAVYLRLRFDNTKIYFEASLNGTSWTTTYSETFGLPGYSLNNAFYYELAAHKTSTNGTLIVDDFSITTNGATLAKSASENGVAAALPESFALSQNYPNPFNIETRVHLDLPEHGRVQAVIYNLQGQEVRRLHDEAFSAGAHVLQWNGANARNESVSTGVYMLRVVFAGESGKREVVTRRLMLIK